MKVTLEQPASGVNPWLRLFLPEAAHDESQGVRRGDDAQDPAERDPAEDETEIEAFWAGRTMAMRRSARVAA